MWGLADFSRDTVRIGHHFREAFLPPLSLLESDGLWNTELHRALTLDNIWEYSDGFEYCQQLASPGFSPTLGLCLCTY